MTYPLANEAEIQKHSRSLTITGDDPGLSAVTPLELEEVDYEGRMPPFPVPWRHPLRAVGWIVRTLFGLASLMVLLAVIAAIPIVNFLALGYLLEVEARVARSGRFREAFPLLNLAPQFGSIVFGVFLWLIPLRYFSTVAADVHLIDPGSRADQRAHLLVNVLWILISTHLCLALARGGTLGCFFRPIKNLRWLLARWREQNYLTTAGKYVKEFLTRMRLRYHFWLGVRGFVTSLVWLFIPTFIMAAPKKPSAGVVVILGGILMIVALAWAPFLQARFAAENRLKAGWEWKQTRELFRHAPLVWLLTVLLIYPLTFPLYLFKFRALPEELRWMFTLLFIAMIYPTRVITGWAYHRAVKKQQQGLRSSIYVRFLAKLLMFPLLAFYVILLYLTPFLDAHGRAVLFEHHLFLVPSPF